MNRPENESDLSDSTTSELKRSLNLESTQGKTEV